MVEMVGWYRDGNGEDAEDDLEGSQDVGGILKGKAAAEVRTTSKHLSCIWVLRGFLQSGTILYFLSFWNVFVKFSPDQGTCRQAGNQFCLTLVTAWLIFKFCPTNWRWCKEESWWWWWGGVSNNSWDQRGMVGWLLAKRNKKGINLEELLAGLLTVGLVVMMMMMMMSMTTILENDYDCQDRVKEIVSHWGYWF